MSTATLDTGPQLRLPMPARYAMAACAVLAPTLTLVAIVLHPVGFDVEGAESVRQFADNLDAIAAPQWLSAIAILLWAPAILAVGRVARAHAPTLGLIGLVLAFGLAIPSTLDSYDLTYVALRSELPVESVTKLLDSAESVPSSVLGWGWLAGLIGLILLGIAVLRGKSAPVWTGVALIVAPIAIPATWFSGSSIAATFAWVVMVIGFTGCAIALVTRTDEQAVSA